MEKNHKKQEGIGVGGGGIILAVVLIILAVAVFPIFELGFNDYTLRSEIRHCTQDWVTVSYDWQTRHYSSGSRPTTPDEFVDCLSRI